MIYDGGRFSLVELAMPAKSIGGDRSLRSFVPDVVVSHRYDPNERGINPPDPRIQMVVDQVDPDRWFADVTTLAGFDRHSLSDEMDDARDWLDGQFSAMPGMDSVLFQEFLVAGEPTWNVIATLNGATQPDDWIIVGAHYDSRRESLWVTSPTPGAEDNASGCAGVLEAARIITASAVPPAQTMKFICYSGEEEGLIGSEFHADQLFSDGNLDKVQLMLNMDMIGYSSDPDIDILLESENPHEALLPLFADAAATYTLLRTVTTLSAWGSDHVPYLNYGVPAILTIENDYSIYPHYHTATDLPENMTRALEMGGGTLRMNMAVLAEMTGIAVVSEVVLSDGFEVSLKPARLD